MTPPKNKKELSMKSYSEATVGPVVYSYVEWILKEAENRQIKKLYFLARDGYLLKIVAEKMALCLGLEIECRYLYCSRQALRIPSYHLIGEEAFDLLLQGGFFLTPRSVLARARLDGEQTEAILDELEIEERNKPLSKKEFAVFSERLRKNERFRNLVFEISRRSYTPALEYFKEAGLFDSELVAIVDSGWTGSMQRTLRQLLQSGGFAGKIIGFYFGLYTPQKSSEDGEYLSFYFNFRVGFWRKLFFNNNLFEIMLSAPHGMTVGYEKKEDAAAPVLSAPHSKKQNALIEKQIEGALEYAEKRLSESPRNQKKKRNPLRECYKILKRAMVYPTVSEAELFSHLAFCDDVTEKYKRPLADKSMLKELNNYLIPKRLLRRLAGKKEYERAGIFWIYGVIAYSKKILRPFYRLNIMLWDAIKIILKK